MFTVHRLEDMQTSKGVRRPNYFSLLVFRLSRFLHALMSNLSYAQMHFSWGSLISEWRKQILRILATSKDVC